MLTTWIDSAIDELYAIRCLWQFRLLEWWATHVSKNPQEAKTLKEMVSTIRMIRSLPPDRQERLFARFLSYLAEQEEEENRIRATALLAEQVEKKRGSE
jgi:hypothetical protein